MTMLFTHQPSAILTFDHNVCNRGGNAFQDALAVQKSAAAAAAAVTALQYRAPGSVDLTDKRSSSFENQATILMPCPKKVSGSCVNAFLAGNAFMASALPSPTLSQSANSAAASHRWGGLASVLEDPEDTLALSAATSAVEDNNNDDDDTFFDQAACAELMEIMSNGSSRSSSNSSSPQPSLHESTAAESSALPFGFFDDHAAASASAIAAAVAANAGIYGYSSPIVRANNPLPNDHSFSPSLPDPTPSEITMHFESFLARHRHQAKVFDFNLNVV